MMWFPVERALCLFVLEQLVPFCPLLLLLVHMANYRDAFELYNQTGGNTVSV